MIMIDFLSNYSENSIIFFFFSKSFTDHKIIFWDQFFTNSFSMNQKEDLILIYDTGNMFSDR